MAKDLTDRTLKSLTTERSLPKARRETPDGKIRGLYFVQQPTGAASWAFRYRFFGSPRKLTIGPYPGIDLKNARDRAGAALVEIAKGIDPTFEKKKARAAARVPTDLAIIDDVVARFIKRYAIEKTRKSSWKETERILQKEIVARWKGRPLASVRRADVHALLDEIFDRGAPIMANRTLAALRRMCAWAVERDIISESPCSGVKAPAAERSRDRILSDEELRLVWRGCDVIGWPFGPIMKLLILTGQRREEVAAMRWSELDLEARIWTLPKERTKNGVEHAVPLSDAAIEIIGALPKVHGLPGFVFTMNGETSVAGFSNAKERIDAYIVGALGEAPARWTLHDLRRTFASGCARLGISLAVIEKILNHTSGSFAGIVGVYQRHSFADEKLAALEAWARFVAELVNGGPAKNIVHMKKRV